MSQSAAIAFGSAFSSPWLRRFISVRSSVVSAADTLSRIAVTSGFIFAVFTSGTTFCALMRFSGSSSVTNPLSRIDGVVE